MRKDSKDKASWLLCSFAHMGDINPDLKGEVRMEKLEYTQPEMEMVEMEVEDIMVDIISVSGEGDWTDPF